MRHWEWSETKPVTFDAELKASYGRSVKVAVAKMMDSEMKVHDKTWCCFAQTGSHGSFTASFGKGAEFNPSTLKDL